MKKLKITLSALLILLIFCLNVEAKDNETKYFVDAVSSETLKSTKLTPVLDSPINTDENLVYCSTFQMAWNDLCNKYAMGTLEIEKAPDYVENLNALYKQQPLLSEDSYLAMSGTGKENILGKINDAVNRKFGYLYKDELPPKFNFQVRSKDIVAFAYLYKSLEFGMPFDITDTRYMIHRNKIFKINTFGFYRYMGEKFNNQFKVLYYTKNKKSLIIKLIGKSSEEVIISTLPVANNLRDTYNDIIKVIDSNKEFQSIEVLNFCIPKINFNIIGKYNELLGKKIINKRSLRYKYYIKDAIHNICLNLNPNGSKTFLRYSYMGIPDMVPVNIECPFVIYIKDKTKNMPYFMAYVATPELLDKNNDITNIVDEKAKRRLGNITDKAETLDVEIVQNPILEVICQYFEPRIEYLFMPKELKFINAQVKDGSNTLLLALKRKTYIQSQMQKMYKKKYGGDKSKFEEYSSKVIPKYYNDLIRYLVSNGADINSSNDSGSTPLIYATENGDFEIVKLLLESNADIKAKRKDGKDALTIAKDKKHANIIKLLIEKQK